MPLRSRITSGGVAQVRKTVPAPTSRARCNAPWTNGVVPLAAMPTTTSDSRTPRSTTAHAHAAARAPDPDVEEPTAASKGGRDQRHGAGDGVARASHRGRHRAVLGDKQVDQ